MQEGKSDVNTVYELIKSNQPILKALIGSGLVSVTILRDLGMYEKFRAYEKQFNRTLSREWTSSDFGVHPATVSRVIAKMEAKV
jgi:hypothetical protein